MRWAMRWESVYASRGRGRWGQSSLVVGRVASRGSRVNAEWEGVVEEVRGQTNEGGVARGRKIQSLKRALRWRGTGCMSTRGVKNNNLMGGCAHEGQRSQPWGWRIGDLRQQPVKQMNEIWLGGHLYGIKGGT